MLGSVKGSKLRGKPLAWRVRFTRRAGPLTPAPQSTQPPPLEEGREWRKDDGCRDDHRFCRIDRRFSGRGPCTLSFHQHPDGAPYAQHGQPSGPGRSGPTAACAEHRKQRIRDHHGESRRQRRARALEEFRGGVLSNVDTGDSLSRQPFLNGDACANRCVEQPQHRDQGQYRYPAQRFTARICCSA